MVCTGLRSSHPTLSLLVVAALATAACATAVPARGGEPTGSVTGHIAFDVPGARLRDIGPVVVYLDAPAPSAADDAPALPDFATPGPIVIEQKNATFSPAFSVVVRGQEVQMPNLDSIYHNAFSYSKPNDFDLGTYPAGESRSIRFDHPGVVKTYCSIHERMNLTIFVSPAPWYAVADASGGFSIAAVPDGRYRLRAWAEKLPPASREIEIRGGETVEIELPLAAD